MSFIRKHLFSAFIYLFVFLIGLTLAIYLVIPPSPLGVLGASIYTAIVKPTPTIEKSQEVLEKIDFSTPTPEYEEQPQAPQVQQIQTIRGAKAQNIDCIGPDGKHLQVTQQECDSFNAAWRKPTQNTKSQNINQQSQLILENAKINAKYLTAQACLDNAKWEVDQCSQSCSNELAQGRGICTFGRDNKVWGEEDRYEECDQEVFAKLQPCHDNCNNTFISKGNQCVEEQKK